MSRVSPIALPAAVTLCVFAASGCAERPSPSEYSVVLVTLDTTRADRIGAFGGTAVRTPNFDASARQGMKFEAAISQVPLTLPSHSSILTGRYPASHGVRHNGVFRLPDTEETLAERLKDEGFHTAAFIAAFVLNHGFGTEQGFDVYDDIQASRYQGGRDSLYEARRSADEVNSEVFDWLERRPSGRFFLWVHYYDAHHPYPVPEGTDRDLEGVGYDRTISYLDSCFGDLVDGLEANGLLDRTILVVAGDHGESLGEHREQTHGVFLYEGAVRVPLWIRAPGLVRDKRTVGTPVELVDIAPTVLDLLGLEPLESGEGVSLVPRMERGEERDPALAYGETFMPRIDFGWSELRMVRSVRWKYIEAPTPELYDLREDPKEEHDLFPNDPERAADMVAALNEWVRRTEKPSSSNEASRALSPQEEARLRSLGYLGGGFFEKGLGPDGARADPKDRIDEGILIFQGRDLLDAGRPEQALEIFDDVLRLNPLNHLARSSKIRCLVRLKRIEEAEEETLASVAAASEDPLDSRTLLEKARRALASIYWMQGKNKEAEEQYRLAIELNQRNEHAAVFGGILLGAASGWEEAMQIVKDVLERNPRDGMAMAAKFELEVSQEMREEAYETAKSLAELRAGDADTLFKAGKLARDFKDPKLAVRLFSLASERKKDDPEILGYLGTSLLAAGDLDASEKVLERVRQLDPDDPRTPFFLGNIALLRNDEARARALMDECLRLDPKFIAARLNLARWLGDRGRFDEAEREVLEALRRTPESREAQDLLRRIREIAASAPRTGGQEGSQ